MSNSAGYLTFAGWAVVIAGQAAGGWFEAAGAAAGLVLFISSLTIQWWGSKS